MNRNLITLLCFVLVNSNSIFSQVGPGLVSKNSIERTVELVVNDKSLKNASLGFYAVDIETGLVIAEYDSDRALSPASTMKTITTSTALQILGPYKTFLTRIEYDGIIDSNKILHGNIYIKGGGDPALGSKFYKDHYGDFMQTWADTIKNFGIDSIDGSVIGDAQVFNENMVPSTWVWGDIGNYYGASPCGLSIYDNILKLIFKSGINSGDSTEIICTEPYVPYLKLTNAVISSNSKKDNAYIYGPPFSPWRIAEGTIPKGNEEFIVKSTLPDPAYVAAMELEYALFQNDVKVRYSPSTVRKKRQDGITLLGERKTIYTTKSPALTSIVHWTNMVSVNLFAEHLLSQIALAKYGKGSTVSGTIAVQKYWQTKGIDLTGFYMNDGSGLSRSNAVTAKQMASILKYMWKSKNAAFFKKSLPIAGKSGTLAGMCKGTKAQGNLIAKSGYMNRIRSYAGYVKTVSGKQLAFAVIVNNYNCTAYEMKKKLEKIMIAMANYNG